MAATGLRGLVGVGISLAFLLLAGTPAAVGQAGDWTMFGASANHSFNTTANPPPAIGILWDHDLVAFADSTSPVTATIDSTLFVFHADLDDQVPSSGPNLWIRKFVAVNGSLEVAAKGWETRLPTVTASSLGPSWAAGPPRSLAVSGGRVYGLFTALNGTHAQDVVFSISVATGDVAGALFSQTTPRPHSGNVPPTRSAPVVGGGLVIFGSRDGNVTALYANNLTLKWRFRVGDAPITTVPAIMGNEIYVTAGTRVHYLALSSGTLVDEVDVGESIGASPAVDATFVFVDAGGTLRAINRTFPPEPGWSQTTGSLTAGALTITGDLVVVRRTDGGVYAYDRATGKIEWVRPGLPATANGAEMAFASDSGRLYASVAAGSTYDLVAVDAADGSVVDRNTTARPALGSPIVAHTMVFVTEGRRLLAFRGQPDLTVLATGVTFNGGPAANGQAVGNLTIGIRNVGTEDAWNVSVSVFDGTTEVGSFTLGTSRAIRAGGSAEAFTPSRIWNVGRHSVRIVIGAVPSETNRANNEATFIVQVQAGPSPPANVVGSGPYWVALMGGFLLGVLLMWLPLRRIRLLRSKEEQGESRPPS